MCFVVLYDCEIGIRGFTNYIDVHIVHCHYPCQAHSPATLYKRRSQLVQTFDDADVVTALKYTCRPQYKSEENTRMRGLRAARHAKDEG